MAIENIKTSPWAGFERVIFAGVKTDTKETYEFDKIIDIVDGAVSMSFNISATDVSHYSSNKKTAADKTFSPSGSVTWAGDDYRIDELLLGSIHKDGGLYDNLGAPNEIAVIAGYNRADGGWMVRFLTKATASKDDMTFATKGESVTFTNPSATLNCMASTYFNNYKIDFDSNDPAHTGKTLNEVIDALLADPMTKFEEVGV